MSHDHTYHLSPAGHLLVCDPEKTAPHSPCPARWGRYRGVDRLPLFIAPDPIIREHVGEPQVQDPRLAAALDEWFDVKSGPSSFFGSRNQATRLLKRFRSFGYQLELLFCELAWQINESSRLSAYPRVEERDVTPLVTYGFDVSWPNCNHSAIVQPGLVPNESSWRAKLNEYGLLDNYDDAAKLRAEYLVVYPYPPFDIYLVHRSPLASA